MKISFYKYSANGNDFILVDNRDGKHDVNNTVFWKSSCERRLGIGADGVIFLENSVNNDFHMRYLNADGAEVSMCGNGARAITHFYKSISNANKNKYQFSTSNDIYESEIDGEFIWIKMVEKYDLNLIDINAFYGHHKGCCYLNTGVPHAIYEVEEVENVSLVESGQEIRNRTEFKEGINVNFISKNVDGYKIRTYERGVEDETLSCGTGITACAHYLWDNKLTDKLKIKFLARGGELEVRKEGQDVYFGGKVQIIYKGEIC